MRSTARPELSQFGSILAIVIAARVPARHSYLGSDGLPACAFAARLAATIMHWQFRERADDPSRLPRLARAEQPLLPLSDLCVEIAPAMRTNFFFARAVDAINFWMRQYHDLLRLVLEKGQPRIGSHGHGNVICLRSADAI